LLLYQALVDASQDAIEQSLGARDQIFAYRMGDKEEEDPFEGSPRWMDYNVALHQLALDEFDGYIIEGDIASYFLNIDIPELERQLLEAGCKGGVVRDLGGLLDGWQAHGVRGLPQGIPPSSPLANFYLAFLDEALRAEGASFIRYMDDFAVVCPSYHEARRLLDLIEETLYKLGLSLGGGKSKIVRSEHVLSRLTPEEGIEELVVNLREAGDYAPDETEIEEIRLDQVCEVFDAAVTALAEDDYRRNEFTFAFRQLGRARNAHALAEIPRVLLRMPGLTAPASRYLEAIASTSRSEVATVMATICSGRFHRVQEWLHLLRVLQVLPNRAAANLSEQLSSMAMDHPDQLVRARALLAWGRQSAKDDFETADRYFLASPRPWLSYPIAAIQGKDLEERNIRYDRWSSEGRPLARLCESLKRERFKWSSI